MRKSTIWLISGAMLLIAALLLIFYNLREDRQGAEYSEQIIQQLKRTLPEQENTDFTEFPTEEDLFARYETPTEPLFRTEDGEFVAIINIPDLGIELPVQSEWSYPGLKISPCRYKGSILTGDIILAAHNYQSHFGRIQELNTGAEILLTDGNGEVHHYEVVQTEIIPGQDVEAMEFGSAENWDLTLFTCTLSGQSRVTVRAVEQEKITGEMIESLILSC